MGKLNSKTALITGGSRSASCSAWRRRRAIDDVAPRHDVAAREPHAARARAPA